jgi:hypothetical protein
MKNKGRKIFTQLHPLKTPVLFLIFNRLDTTRQVFEAIRQAKPPRLYIAADGPRDDKLEEDQKVQAIREYVVNNINWDCEVKTLFREKNLGCRYAVSGGITWFFENEEMGIVLEDDCLPSLSFFWFCEELLERYRQDTRVMVISGDYFHGKAHEPVHSYFFSRYNHCWGWASWRRAWQFYDRDMGQWPRLRKTDWLIRVGDSHRDFREYWKKIFDAAHAGKADTWDYQWTFSCWVQNGLTVLPLRNLVKNIGFGQDSTHTKGDGGWIARLPLEFITFPLSHPDQVARDKVADRWSDLNVIGTKVSCHKRIVRKIPGAKGFYKIFASLFHALKITDKAKAKFRQ